MAIGINSVALPNKSAQQLADDSIGSTRDQVLKGIQDYVSLKGKKDLEQQAQQKNLETAQGILADNAKSGRKVGVSLSGEGGVNVTQNEPNPTGLLGLLDRKQARTEREAQGLSKQYGQGAEFMSALKELDSATNSDGKGGVLSNPNATIKGTGQIASALPTGAVAAGEGIGSLLGKIGLKGAQDALPDKGSAEQRKLLERLQLAYQKSITGMRTSEDMAKRERAAMGMMASADSQLASKGVRSLARLQKEKLDLARGGYSPEVQDLVKKQMGMDPMEHFANIYDDYAPKPQAAGQAPAAPSAPGAQAAGSGKQVVKTLRNKRTGQTKVVYSDGSEELQ